MTDCLAVVAGNFEPVEDKPLKELVTGLLDKKGTGCSLAVSINYGIYHKNPAVWMDGEWWALPIKGAGGSLVLNGTVVVINCEYGQMTNIFTMLLRAMIKRFNRECRLVVMAGEIRKYTVYRKRWPRS